MFAVRRAIIAACLVAAPATARSDEPARLPLRVDGGLVAARPAALPTGLSSGFGAGVTHGCWLAWGARASWSTASEYTSSWLVEQQETRLRLVAALQHHAGRGTIALRLGAGGTLVHEKRTRDQGERAGLTGDELRTTAWRMLPGGELELGVSLRIAGRWSAELSTGPSLHLEDGDASAGWVGSLGVGWQP